MEDWEILARVMIGSLHTRYVAAIDGKPPEAFAEVFTPTGVLASGITGKEVSGADLRTYIGDVRATRHEKAWQTMRHFITPANISFTDRDHADAQCYFTAMSAVGVDHWGMYSDQVECQDGQWLIARRSISLLGATPGGWVHTGSVILAKN